VTHFVTLIVILLGVGLYFMTPAERTRVLQAVLAGLRRLKAAATFEEMQSDPFFEALRARTPRVLAMPALLVLSTIVFIQSSVLSLIINAACLWQIGLILERVVGRVAFTTVYVASGAAAGIIGLSASGDASIGASGAVLGIYGLLLVTSIWCAIDRSSLAIPLDVAKQLAPVAAIFVLYKLMTTGLWSMPSLAAVVCGLIGGIIVARDLDSPTPQLRRLATAMGAIVTVVGLYAVAVMHPPANETVDIRPEIDRVIAVEARTVDLYEKEVERFRKGRITALALAAVIEKTIVPELRAVAGRLGTLKDVPPEDQPVVAAAQQFLKLRDESWQLRVTALHKSDMRGLRQADTKERASREVFHRLQMPPQASAHQPAS
jgi:membrane associated rhomboid family serine protease